MAPTSAPILNLRRNAYEQLSLWDVTSDQQRHKKCIEFHNRLAVPFSVSCVLPQRGTSMELNKRYAALMLMEILYERGLVNRETLQAAREKFEEDRRILLAA